MQKGLLPLPGQVSLGSACNDGLEEQQHPCLFIVWHEQYSVPVSRLDRTRRWQRDLHSRREESTSPDVACSCQALMNFSKTGWLSMKDPGARGWPHVVICSVVSPTPCGKGLLKPWATCSIKLIILDALNSSDEQIKKESAGWKSLGLQSAYNAGSLQSRFGAIHSLNVKEIMKTSPALCSALWGKSWLWRSAE